MTLSIPERLRRQMGKHVEVRWSAVARQAIEQRGGELELLDSVLSHSKLTEADAETIGHRIKHEMAEKFRKRFGK